VDWRTALLKFVNREDGLGPVRLALLRVIDPVEWYMAKNDEERRRSHRKRRTGASGWTGYAPLEHELSGPELKLLRSASQVLEVTLVLPPHGIVPAPELADMPIGVLSLLHWWRE
jgi:hypothetical protein